MPPILSPSLPQTAPVISPYQVSNQHPYANFANNISSQYPDLGFSDLDFLDSFPVQGANNLNPNSDALQDLGFRMELGDGTHDWSEGNGFDLFDGFFFGSGGGGGGGV